MWVANICIGTVHHLPSKVIAAELFEQCSGRSQGGSTFPPQAPKVNKNCKLSRHDVL